MAVNPETLNPSGKKGGKKKGGKKPWSSVGSTIGSVGDTGAKAGGGSKNIKKNKQKVRRNRNRAIRQANREARADFRKTQFTQTISANTASKEQRKMGWKPKTKDVLGDLIEEDIRATDPGAINPAVGTATKIAKPLARITVALADSPAKSAAGFAGKKLPKILAKDAKSAEKKAVKEAVEEGEKVAVKREGKAAAKKADKKIAKEAKSKVKPKRVKAKERTVKFAKKHRPTSTAGKMAMKGATNERIRKAVIAGGIGGPVVAGPGAAVVQNTVEAAKEDPTRFKNTSLQGLQSLATAPVKLAIEGGEAIATGNTKPLEKEAGAQLDYWRDYPKLADPGSEEAKGLILKKYGVTPIVTGALGVHAGTRPILSRFPKTEKEPKVVRQGGRIRRVSKVREDAGNPDKRIAEPAQEALMRAEKGRHGKRRAVAREKDLESRRAKAMFNADMREKGTAAGKGRTFEGSMRELAKVPIAEGVNLSDAVKLVHSYSVPLDATAGRVKLLQIRDHLGDADVTHETVHTRQVLDALIENPSVLEHSDLARVYESMGKITRDQNSGPFAPDPQDRARHVPLARLHKVPTPEERVPHELRGKVKVKVGKYVEMDKRLRGKAKELERRAAKKAAQARAHPKGSAKRLKYEQAAEADRLQAEEIRAIVNRPQKAKKLDAEAYAAREAGDMAEAERLTAEAQALRKAHTESVQRRVDEFHDEMSRVYTENGERQPIFFHDQLSYDTGNPVAGGREVKNAGAAKGDQMKTGKARELGIVDESGTSLIEGIYRDRANVEMNQGLKRILEAHVEGKMLTGRQARAAMASGDAPTGKSLIPLQDFKRAYKRGDWKAALGMIEDSEAGMRNRIAEADFVGEGKKYAWIDTSVLDEVYSQGVKVGKFARGLKAFGGANSIALLGTSPTWVAFQGFATPIILAARHPNPVTWAKAARDVVRLYKDLTPRERASFAANFGGNIGDIQGHFKWDEFGPTPGHIRSMSDASKVASRTWAGKLLSKLYTGGGPLIRGVAKYEGALRTFEALMESDKLYNRTAATKWVNSLAALDHETRAQIATVSKLPRSEQLKYLANPENTKAIEKRVIDTIGDWTSMTAFEKRATGALIFYPFLRFSLKWLFHTFPKENPVKAAILLNLAQANSQDVEKLLGGTPSFYQSFGIVTYRDANGELQGVNLARANPAGNALIEGLGSGEQLSPVTLGRIFNPTLSALFLQGAFGLDPWTGEKVGQNISDNFMLFSKQILGLNPAGRAWGIPWLEQNSKFLEPSPTAEYFRALEGKSAVEKAFDPLAAFSVNKSIERAKLGASEILDKAGAAPTPEEVGQIAEQIAQDHPGLNANQLAELPEMKDLVQRARAAQKWGDAWTAILESKGLSSDPEVDRNFSNIMSLIDPRRFGGSTIERRTEAQRVRYLKRQKGLSGSEIGRDYPTLPEPYAIKIEALRRSGMTDREIAAKYPSLRKHLPSLSSSSGIGSSSIGESKIGGSSIGSSSIGG